MKLTLSSFLLYFIFSFHAASAQPDKTYKDFDTVKIELWKRVSDVNHLQKQQYSVREADSLIHALNPTIEFIRIFYTMGEIRKMEVRYQSGERRDFLWWNQSPLLVGVMKKDAKKYDIQYYFFDGVLYETKNPHQLPTESESILKKQETDIRMLGYEVLKYPER